MKAHCVGKCHYLSNDNEQPVVYEFAQITSPALLIIGQGDRTIVGKELLTEEQKSKYGQYPQLGKR